MRTPKTREAAAPVRRAAQKGSGSRGRIRGAGDEGGGVGADAEEGDVSEVEEAGEADDDVEAQGDGREDQDVGPDDRVLVGVLGEGEAGGGDEGRAEGHAAVGVGECGQARDESGPVEGGRASTMKIR